MTNFRLARRDGLRLAAPLLWLLPAAVLPPLGLWWLWHSGYLVWWLSALVLCAALGLGLQTWLRRQDRRLLAEHETQPNPDWLPRDQAAWQAIKDLASGLKTEDWPLDERLWLLGHQALERVARTYHPQREQPLLELTQR